MKNNKEGTYKERKRRAFVLDKMIHGLYACQNTPATWQDVETQHIHQLVKCWKQQRIKPTTIMRYMVIIRKIIADLDYHVPDVDNKSLQLTRPKPRKKRIKMDADFWQCLTPYPPVRMIMALQIQFGLTFNEAIKIRSSVNIQGHQLTISDNIAFNSRERVIPVCTKQQQTILNELNHLLDTDINLIKKYGHSHLTAEWHSELIKYNLPSNKSWRYWYAKQRVEMLLPEAGLAQAYRIIHEEMGIKSRNTLWSYLNR